MGTSDQFRKKMAAKAHEKLKAGETPTQRELTALRAVERELEEKKRWDFYRSIPQKHWAKMSGRQPKVINEQAKRYGIPFDGAEVDLPAVVMAFHDFLADNAQTLAAAEEKQDTRDRSLEIKMRRELLKLEKEEGTVVPREEVRQLLGHLAMILRQAGEALGRQYGADAQRVIEEALEDYRRVIAADGTLADDESGS